MSYIITYTGEKFDYLNITPDSVDIYDIIHALPRINRFVGHSIRPYSVGEHTIYCYEMAKKLGYTPRQQLVTFLHDFTEAYVGDCPSPLKELLPFFKEIEYEVEKAIYQKLNIPMPTEEEYELIKKVDLTMLVIEMRDLTLHNHEEFISDRIYTNMLDDKEFKLSPKIHFTEKSIQHILKMIFRKLMNDSNII